MNENNTRQNTLVLSLGSNQGDKKQNIEKAYCLLEQRLGKIQACSDFFVTEPWGFDSEEMFVNSACIILTPIPPEECLEIIHETEKQLGRVRNKKKGYSDRTIDIDILFYSDEIINTPCLKIPHPLLHLREFVLTPLRQICPEFYHPVLKKKIKDI